MQRFLLCIVILSLASCSTNRKVTYSNYTFKAPGGIPDYSDLDFWAAHPWKKDPSDSLPRKLRRNYHPDSTVDIFFLYPTSYTSRSKPFGMNAPVDDSALNRKTDFNAILYQASIFNEAGRVFAPRYRQANYFAYFPTDSAASLAAFDTAYKDIKTAFEYYLAHYNNGRPIVIAAHSQGSTHAKRLLKEFFENKPLYQKLVAAYIPGMPVEPDYFTRIPVCSAPDQTGCFCSWRTFREGYVNDLTRSEPYTALVTNPLSWDTAHTAISRQNNKGAVLYRFNKLTSKVAGAQIEEGYLWTEKPHFFGSSFLKTFNYHIGDYNFYYLSVRENVQRRINAFRKKS